MTMEVMNLIEDDAARISAHLPTAESRPVGPKYPNVTVELTGQGGNAYGIIGRTIKALRQAGASRDEIDAFMAEAASGDFDKVLATVIAWVEAI